MPWHDALQCFTCQNQSEVKLFRFPRAACSRGCSAFATSKRKLSGYITLRLTDKGLDLEQNWCGHFRLEISVCQLHCKVTGFKSYLNYVFWQFDKQPVSFVQPRPAWMVFKKFIMQLFFLSTMEWVGLHVQGVCGENVSEGSVILFSHGRRWWRDISWCQSPSCTKEF